MLTFALKPILAGVITQADVVAEKAEIGRAIRKVAAAAHPQGLIDGVLEANVACATSPCSWALPGWLVVASHTVRPARDSGRYSAARRV